MESKGRKKKFRSNTVEARTPGRLLPDVKWLRGGPSIYTRRAAPRRYVTSLFSTNYQSRCGYVTKHESQRMTVHFYSPYSRK